MIELFRTNNLIALSYAQSVLAEAGIASFLLDAHMSVIEGSLGVLPRRLMVADEHKSQAEAILRSSGLADELNG
jgi:Putative prokaryotic signal transducing protein